MGQWLTGLAVAARETGYPVIEIPGWKTRGQGALADDVRIITDHHTAGPEPERTSSNYPSLNVVKSGRTGLRGLLSQLGMGFNGTIYVIGAGVAWHAGEGSWKGWTNANYRGIGIEAEDGGDGDWTMAQLDCYPRLNAALCRYLGVSADWVAGHKEYATPRGRKIDPAGIEMSQMRRTTAWYLANPHKIRKGSTMSDIGPEKWDQKDFDRFFAKLWAADMPLKGIAKTILGGNDALSYSGLVGYAASNAYQNPDAKEGMKELLNDEARFKAALAEVVQGLEPGQVDQEQLNEAMFQGLGRLFSKET